MMELATWILAALTGALVLVALWYSCETRQYRKVATATLEQLRSEHTRTYETYVVADGWDKSGRPQFVNLGPGPALRVQIRAVSAEGDKRRYFETAFEGLAVGHRMAVALRTTEPFPDFADLVDGPFNLLIVARTVLGQEMPPMRLNLPKPLPFTL